MNSTIRREEPLAPDHGEYSALRTLATVYCAAPLAAWSLYGTMAFAHSQWDWWTDPNVPFGWAAATFTFTFAIVAFTLLRVPLAAMVLAGTLALIPVDLYLVLGSGMQIDDKGQHSIAVAIWQLAFLLVLFTPPLALVLAIGGTWARSRALLSSAMVVTLLPLIPMVILYAASR